MSQPVVLDLETQHTFREVGNDAKKLKISLAGLYDYASDQYLAFEEHELSKLFPYLENASEIIGFNIIDFDLPVLAPYYVGDVKKFVANDLLAHVQKSLGFRLSLDALAKETLGTQKNGHGLLAIEYFRNGEMEKLKAYCLSDVKITKEVYEYGKAHGKVYYQTATGRQEIPVDWVSKASTVSSSVNLTLPW
ncbi:helicase [Candidatus Microgenomates bacterium]|nr:MAG: helicase [Candidatus Microgenomates bacterium]